LFAIHPMHVESVAWAAERKDVLSAFFALLSLLAYVSYAILRESSIAQLEKISSGDVFPRPVSDVETHVCNMAFRNVAA
jgi:hypothetical protein